MTAHLKTHVIVVPNMPPIFCRDVFTPPDLVTATLQSPERAAFLTALKTDPLFRHDPAMLLSDNDHESRDFVNGQVKDYANDTINLLNYGKDAAPEIGEVSIRDWLLAKAFPARTGPLGSRKNEQWEDKNNFDMMTSDKFMTEPTKWPEQRRMFNEKTKEMEPVWWHTDYEDVAYLHVWKLYQKLVDCVQKGGRQQ